MHYFDEINGNIPEKSEKIKLHLPSNNPNDKERLVVDGNYAVVSVE